MDRSRREQPLKIEFTVIKYIPKGKHTMANVKPSSLNITELICDISTEPAPLPHANVKVNATHVGTAGAMLDFPDAGVFGESGTASFVLSPVTFLRVAMAQYVFHICR